MLILIVIILILLFLVVYLLIKVYNPNTKATNSQDIRLKAIKSELKQILKEDNIKCDFVIKESNYTKSYTEDDIIYLTLFDSSNQPYDTNTIRYLAIHQLAHLVSNNKYDHTDLFNVLEDRYQKIAAKKFGFELNLRKKYPDQI